MTEEIANKFLLSSCDFDKEINEFDKAGFTEVKSGPVSPPRVKESPINFNVM